MKFPVHTFFIIMLSMTTHYANSAEPGISDWLEMSAGSQGEQINAKVLDVERKDGITVIDIQLPESALENLEYLKVQARDKTYIKQPREPATLVDENGAPYGIRIYLKKTPNLEFRIRLFDELATEGD